MKAGKIEKKEGSKSRGETTAAENARLCPERPPQRPCSGREGGENRGGRGEGAGEISKKGGLPGRDTTVEQNPHQGRYRENTKKREEKRIIGGPQNARVATEETKVGQERKGEKAGGRHDFDLKGEIGETVLRRLRFKEGGKAMRKEDLSEKLIPGEDREGKKELERKVGGGGGGLGGTQESASLCVMKNKCAEKIASATSVVGGTGRNGKDRDGTSKRVAATLHLLRGLLRKIEEKQYNP